MDDSFKLDINSFKSELDLMDVNYFFNSPLLTSSKLKLNTAGPPRLQRLQPRVPRAFSRAELDFVPHGLQRHAHLAEGAVRGGVLVLLPDGHRGRRGLQRRQQVVRAVLLRVGRADRARAGVREGLWLW